MPTRDGAPGSRTPLTLRLDHLIIRAADPGATMAELVERAGTPVLAGPEPVGGLLSGVVRAGSIDIEVLRIGREPPPRPHGYGVGLVASTGLREASASLRALGFATSVPTRGVAGDGARRRTWSAIQVRGLLPDPFPAPAGRRRPGRRDRLLEAASAAVGAVPALARAATRTAGASMVVVTQYGFDAGAWRDSAGAGPEVVAVHLGTGGCRDAWERLPLADGVRSLLHLHDEGPPGITKLVMDGGPSRAPDGFSLGDVSLEFTGRPA